MKKRINATVKATGNSVVLYYETLTEARKRNKGLEDFYYA
jgi:hypothetical protein